MRPITFFQIALYIIFLIPLGIVAQQNTFSKVFTDPANGSSAQAYSVVETHDSNFIIVGYLDEDALILKMDQYGEKIWDKQLIFSNFTIFYRIIPTVDSNYIIVGTGGPENDIICMKISENGDTLWVRNIDFGNNESVTSLQATNDHGCIIGGNSSTGYPNPNTIGLVKLSATGSMEWSVTLSPGEDNRIISSIRQTSDSGYILTGELINKNIIPYEYLAFLIKLDTLGNVTWAQRLITASYENECGYDVIEIPYGYLCLTSGYYNYPRLIGIDFLGNILWSKKLNINSWHGLLYQFFSPQLHPLSDGTYVFVNTGQFGYLLKIDIMGNILWMKNLWVDVADVIPVSDQGYLVVGNGPLYGVKDSTSYNPQIGMIKTDSSGNSMDCINDTWITTDTLPGYFESFTVTSNPGGATITPIYPEIINASLQSISGCVEITPGINEISFRTPRLVISPNPSNGRILVELEPYSKEFSVIEIYNFKGMRIYSTDANHPLPLQLELSSLPDGIYYIRAMSDKEWYSQKIIIIH